MELSQFFPRKPWDGGLNLLNGAQRANIANRRPVAKTLFPESRRHRTFSGRCGGGETLRKGKRLGKNDRLVLWRKPWPWQRPRYLPKPVWKLIPQQLSVR